MTNEQAEQIIALLERIAVALETKPSTAPVDDPAAFRGGSQFDRYVTAWPIDAVTISPRTIKPEGE